MEHEIRRLVSADAAMAVAKKIHGSDAQLLDYAVEKGTSSVQGFLSNILRLSVRVKVGEETRLSRFVVKRQPVLKSQQKLTRECGVFEHEMGFFEKCVPILKERCPELPVVVCYLCDEPNCVIYMEDLKEANYCTVVAHISALQEGNILSMDHMEIVMKTLAKFHSASVGIDWLEKFPEIFSEDIFFERGDGVFIKDCISETVKNTLIPIARHYFGDEKHVESVEWLGSEGFYQLMISMSKPDPKGINVLCHGDSWANNMMFHVDPESGKPTKVKLIDFQMSRYAPSNRDLLYFLHMCCPPRMRQKHESELLRTYWRCFEQEMANRGEGSVPCDWDEFYAGYDSSRAFGLMMSATVRPSIYVEEAFPRGNEELTDEQMELMMAGGGFDADRSILEFENNPVFRQEIIDSIEEVTEVYHRMYKNRC